MNPYKNLISNTFLFGVSTFGARFLTFLLTPFYTRVLSSTEYGITDLLIQTGNLLIPIASAGIANGVIRYGLERSTNKASVFTVGLLTTLAGFALLLLTYPVLDSIPFLSGYVPVLTLATTFACLGSFLSSVYMVEQRSTATLVTTMLGAACNLAGNFFLIQLWGSMGAAVSTQFSYALIFSVRVIHTRTMLRIRWSIPKAFFSVLFLGVQCIVMEADVGLWPVWSGICLLLVCAVHFNVLLSAARKSI